MTNILRFLLDFYYNSTVFNYNSTFFNNNSTFLALDVTQSRTSKHYEITRQREVKENPDT